MTTTDYLIDSLLVLMVLLQIKERPLTTRTLIRPLVIVSVAVFNYLHGIPTAGNDLVLIAVVALTGTLIGIASGQTLIMRSDDHGRVLSGSGWASGFFWVLGMGSRFAFIYSISHSGAASLAQFSAAHQITGAQAWATALLAMAVFEVAGRRVVQALRSRQLQITGPTPQIA